MTDNNLEDRIAKLLRDNTSISHSRSKMLAATVITFVDVARRGPAVGEDGLPPLPEPAGQMNKKTTRELEWPFQPGWTAEQVRQAQRDAIASLQASFDAAMSLAGETIDARNAEIAGLRAQLARKSQEGSCGS